MTKINKQKFSRAIKQYRKKYDLTQLELASKIKTTSNTVARWEREETVPKNELLLSKLIELGINW
jgi:transcriptional regulator with XRE-family HTH domain